MSEDALDGTEERSSRSRSLRLTRHAVTDESVFEVWERSIPGLLASLR